MNKERRKRLETIKSQLEGIQQEEQDYYDNMPEGLQGGENGEKASAAAEALQEAVDKIGEAIE